MEPHSREPDLETCGIADLYDRLKTILTKARPDRLAAFQEFLDEQEKKESAGTESSITQRRPR